MPLNARPTCSPHAQQRGAVLIVGIIFLLIMTMLGITAMQTTTLEERMAGNTRDRGLAFQAAEIALRAGEQEVFAGPPTSGAGFYDFQASAAPDPTIADKWSSGTTRTTSWTTTDDFPNLSQVPQYWIEARLGRRSLEVGKPQEIVYDITARSTGASGKATVVLGSTARY